MLLPAILSLIGACAGAYAGAIFQSRFASIAELDKARNAALMDMIAPSSSGATREQDHAAKFIAYLTLASGDTVKALATLVRTLRGDCVRNQDHTCRQAMVHEIQLYRNDLGRDPVDANDISAILKVPFDDLSRERASFLIDYQPYALPLNQRIIGFQVFGDGTVSSDDIANHIILPEALADRFDWHKYSVFVTYSAHSYTAEIMSSVEDRLVCTATVGLTAASKDDRPNVNIQFPNHGYSAGQTVTDGLHGAKRRTCVFGAIRSALDMMLSRPITELEESAHPGKDFKSGDTVAGG